MIKLFLFCAILISLLGCHKDHSPPTNPIPQDEDQKKVNPSDTPFGGLPMLGRGEVFEILRKMKWKLYGLIPETCSLDPRKASRVSAYMEPQGDLAFFYRTLGTCIEEYKMETHLSLENDGYRGPRLQLMLSRPSYIKKCADSPEQQPDAVQILSLELDESHRYMKVHIDGPYLKRCFWTELVM